MFKKVIFTARGQSLGQGNVLTPVCHSVYQRGTCITGEGEYVWLGGKYDCGVCMAGHPRTVGKRAVPILMECCLFSILAYCLSIG